MTNPRNPEAHGAENADNTQAPGSIEDMTKSIQGQFKAVVAVPRALLEAQLTLGSELFGFMSRRMKAQAELCHELSQCRELSDAMQAHRKFSERVTSDYSEQLSQMATMLRNELTTITDASSAAVAEANQAAKLAA